MFCRTPKSAFRPGDDLSSLKKSGQEHAPISNLPSPISYLPSPIPMTPPQKIQGGRDAFRYLPSPCPISHPAVAPAGLQVEICWNPLTNQTYQVQYRSSLTTDMWTDLGAPVPGSATTFLQDSRKDFIAWSNCPSARRYMNPLPASAYKMLFIVALF